MKRSLSNQEIDLVIHTSNPRKITQLERRQLNYPNISEQLDMLWHDIEAGHFGAKAKNSSWFKEIDRVKKEHPKDTK